LYSYTSSNPIVHIDPDGLDIIRYGCTGIKGIPGLCGGGGGFAGGGAKASSKNKSCPPDKYSRPSGYRKGVPDKAWDDAIEKSTGRVRDPKTGQFMSKTKPWDMGHKPGYEFRKHQESARNRNITREKFLDEHNNPSHYRPELPRSNRSHSGEDMTNSYFGP